MDQREMEILGQIGGRPRALPYYSSALAEIRLGARITPVFKAEVMETIDKLSHRPQIIQMGCDFDRFVLTESSCNK
jgi:hypothetical protein